jgi:hypothetical protein
MNFETSRQDYVHISVTRGRVHVLALSRLRKAPKAGARKPANEIVNGYKVADRTTAPALCRHTAHVLIKTPAENKG